jgi:thiol-disulfide isomerase/thioredoxin
MSLRRSLLLVLLVASPVLVSSLAGKAPDRTKPKIVPAFKLVDPRSDTPIDMSKWKDDKAIVVVFLGTECPLSNEYLPELARLYKNYAGKGVRFLGINANRQDTPARVAAHARKHEVPFAVVKDPGNKVADLFGAKRTPEAFLLDGSGKVLYQGCIDDQFGIGYRRAGKPTRRDLVCAIEDVLAGKVVQVARTEPAGCFIGRLKATKEDGKVTYTKHISRILQKRCQECHRPGQIGPMPLLEYDDAVSWSETIREVIDEGRMPPWHADPRFGKWSNDRRLSAEEKETLKDWLDAGMPKGDDRDLPAPLKFSSDWKIGKPDLVFEMPEPYKVPAETPPGGIPYKHFVVPTNFKEDRWIERAEARAGATSVVHHIVVFIMKPGALFQPEASGSTLCGMAPGDLPMILQPGFAKKIPAGSKLLFQMHYTPNGKEAVDRSSVGLIFAKKPPKHHVLTKPILNHRFVMRLDSIPAGADNYQIEASHVWKRDARIIHFFPHMHLRGKDFLFEAVAADGKKETLLSVPRYDFNWQSVYRAEKPVAMPKGSTLRCVGHFDNSKKNPSNPDPTKRVYWGDQTWEEMLVGWIDYYYADQEKP